MGDRMDKEPYPWRQQIILEIKKMGGGALESGRPIGFQTLLTIDFEIL